MSDQNIWRSRLGTGAALWASAGRHSVEPGRWVALSGLRNASFNVALCHGGDLPDGIKRSIEEIEEAGSPGVVMLAGEANGWAQVLVAAGWVCVGAMPLMRLECSAMAGSAPVDGVRRLTGTELESAREVFIQGNRTTADVAEVALPDSLIGSESMSLWGCYTEGRLASILALGEVEGSATIWSMTTAPDFRRRGCGRRLLQGVLASVGSSGQSEVLLTATAMSEALYYEAGFREVEWWQQWSRPRWVLGRTR